MRAGREGDKVSEMKKAMQIVCGMAINPSPPANQASARGIKCPVILWCAISVLSMGWSTPAGGATYLTYYDHTGTWIDANKTWVDDTLLCWAAAASNILEGGGGGTAEYDTADKMFEYLKDHFTDTTGSPTMAYQFWFYGSYGPGGGGGFYPGLNYSDYYCSSPHLRNRMLDIGEFLRAGHGTYAKIEIGGTAHAITTWGYEYDPAYEPDDSEYYTHLYFTDSDDRATELQMGAISQDDFSGAWSFDDGIREGWEIRWGTALKQDPFIDLPDAYFWADNKKALEGLHDLLLYLSFDYKWDHPFPEPPPPGDPWRLQVQIETPNGWQTLYEVLLEQDTDGWHSLNIPIDEEFQGLQRLRFLVDGDAGVQFYRLHPIPEPATLSLLTLGGLVILRRRRRLPREEFFSGFGLPLSPPEVGDVIVDQR